MYGNSALIAVNVLKKDSVIFVDGQLEYHEYENGDKTSEVRCFNFCKIENHPYYSKPSAIPSGE